MIKQWFYMGLIVLGLLSFASSVYTQAPTSFKIFDEGAFVSTIRSINCIGADISCVENTSAHRVDISVGALGASAPFDAEYVTLSLDGTLTAERVLTGTANQITITDGGANTTVTLSTPQDIHTGASPIFSSMSFNAAINQIVLDADGTFTGTITMAALSASRIYTFPDVTGEISLLGQSIDLTSEVTGILSIANGGTNVSSIPTNGQLLIGNGITYVLNTITGTNNQIIVNNGAGTITLSTPQNIHTGASPIFNTLNLEADTLQIVLDSNGTFAGTISMTTLSAPRAYIFPDESGTICTLTSGCGGAAPTSAEYVVLAFDTTLSNERRLVGTANQIILTDGGANGNVTLSTPQNIDTAATPTFGSMSFNAITNQIVLDADGTFTGAITMTALTASRIYTFPDATGEISVLGQTIDLTSEVTSVLPVANGGTNTSSIPTNGQLLIGDGVDYTLATLTGTANQITVTNGAGSITLSTPQDIDTAATPTFGSLSLDAAINQIVLDADGTFTGTMSLATLTASQTWTFPDDTGTIALVDPSSVGIAELLDRDTTDTTVANTTTETTVYTFSVPANVMESDRRLRLTMLTLVTDNTGGAAETLTLRLKFGSTTLVTTTIDTTDGTTDVGYPIQADIANDGSTAIQEGELKVQRETSSPSVLVTAIGRGSAVEDTTGSLILSLTVQWNKADPNLSFTMDYATLELT